MGSVTTNTVTSQPRPAAAGLIPTQVQTPVPGSYMIAQGSSAIQPTSQSVQKVKVGDVGLFETDGYYVGAERQFPLPYEIQQAWDDIIPSLSGHLDLVVRRLKQSIPPERRRVEPDLCWACQKSLLPGFRRPDLVLKPTVWIRCGGSRCQRKVEQSIDDLGYFRQFLERFGIRKPVFSRDVPWTAGLVQPPYVSNLPEKILKISLAIQCEYGPPICGARARYTIEMEDSSTTRLYSTIGGAVVVSNQIYGLTTAHSIVDFLQPETSDLSAVSPRIPEQSDDSASESDSEPVSNKRRPSSSESVPDLLSEWVEVPLPSAFMYRGFGTTGKEISGEPAPAFCGPPEDTSDFALMQIEPMYGAVNSFYGTEGYSEIKGHLDQHELGEGEVQIITTNTAEPVVGYMLKRDARLILLGRTMCTKRIQIDSKFEPYHGLSGAWVVRSQRLCGIVYAAYDYAPYLHMIPAYTMFENMERVLKCHVAVATPSLDLYPDSPTTVGSVDQNDSKIQESVTQRRFHFDKIAIEPQSEGQQEKLESSATSRIHSTRLDDPLLRLPKGAEQDNSRASHLLRPIIDLDPSPVVAQFLHSTSYEHWDACAERAQGLIQERLKALGDSNEEEIPAMLTRRAKTRKSLERKLKMRNLQRSANGQEEYSLMSEILEDVQDLAGVRVVLSTPSKAQRSQVKEVILGLWGPDVRVQKQLGSQAEHYNVTMKETHSSYHYIWRKGDVVEIQVTSALGHAWTEAYHNISHSIHAHGQPPGEELRILDALSGFMASGDLLLEQIGESIAKRTVAQWQHFGQFDMFLEDLDIPTTTSPKGIYQGKPRSIVKIDFSLDFSMEGKDILYRFLVKTGNNYPSVIRNILLRNFSYPDDLGSELRGYEPMLRVPRGLSAPLCIISTMSSDIASIEEGTPVPGPAEEWRLMIDAMILLQTFAGGPRQARDFLLLLPMTESERESINYLLPKSHQEHYFLSHKELEAAWDWFAEQAKDHQSLCGLFFRLARLGVRATRADEDVEQRVVMLDIESL